jgi:cytochrome c peroxidase
MSKPLRLRAQPATRSLALAALVLAGCSRHGTAETSGREGEPVVIPLRVPSRDADLVRRDRAKGLAPVEAPALDELAMNRAALGRRMFFDVQLGGGAGLSCTGCHPTNHAGAGAPVLYGAEGRLDVPTLVNLRHYARFGSEGATASLRGFLAAHVSALSSGRDPVARDVAIDAAYGGALRGLFPTPEGEGASSIVGLAGKALGAYLETVVTPSRFDAFLRGDAQALSPQELEGFDAFFVRGCVSCHDGPALGGRVVATLGLALAWPGDAPLGEHAEWKARRARRVSSLRAVAESAPYFHEGAIGDLPTAVQLMATHQLGVTVPDRERDALVAFLRAASGPAPANFRGP